MNTVSVALNKVLLVGQQERKDSQMMQGKITEVGGAISAATKQAMSGLTMLEADGNKVIANAIASFTKTLDSQTSHADEAAKASIAKYAKQVLAQLTDSVDSERGKLERRALEASNLVKGVKGSGIDIEQARIASAGSATKWQNALLAAAGMVQDLDDKGQKLTKTQEGLVKSARERLTGVYKGQLASWVQDAAVEGE